MKLYDELTMIDVLEEGGGLFDSAAATLEDDDTFSIKPTFASDLPWLISGIAQDRDCFRWRHIYHKVWNHVPRSCFGCFKIACHPRTLKGVLAIEQFQKSGDVPSKTGMERRPYSPHLYSAFWYAPLDGGLDGARTLYHKLKVKIREILGVQTDVTLKRACTEMELQRGPSDTWKWTMADDLKEDMLDSVVGKITEVKRDPPKFQQLHVLRKLIEYAWEHGDETAKEFISVPLIRPALRYEDSEHKHEDFLAPPKPPVPEPVSPLMEGLEEEGGG